MSAIAACRHGIDFEFVQPANKWRVPGDCLGIYRTGTGGSFL